MKKPSAAKVKSKSSRFPTPNERSLPHFVPDNLIALDSGFTVEVGPYSCGAVGDACA